MVQIVYKEECCGCRACVQSCPTSCIRMFEDREGFFYPKVDQSKCIDCGLCERVCPCLNPYKHREPMSIFAVRSNKLLVREQSSSGGLFWELANWILDQKGVVFGARFTDKWTVEHDYTELEEGLRAFRGSKYVESNIGDTFKKAYEFLKQGRWVLFTGTSCQISALNHFLKKKYDCLLTVDVVCHGVPSTKVWATYLNYLTDKQPESIRNIQFRSKETGWKNYSFLCDWKNHHTQEVFQKNLYMKGYLSDSFLRPSCYHCTSKMFATESDLTIADYWGVQYFQPEIDDDIGIGLVFVHSEKALKIVKSLPVSLDMLTIPFEKLQIYNRSIKQSVKRPLKIKRVMFYKGMNLGIPFSLLVNVITKKRGIIGVVKQFLGKK